MEKCCFLLDVSTLAIVKQDRSLRHSSQGLEIRVAPDIHGQEAGFFGGQVVSLASRTAYFTPRVPRIGLAVGFQVLFPWGGVALV